MICMDFLKILSNKVPKLVGMNGHSICAALLATGCESHGWLSTVKAKTFLAPPRC
jgi:hypothetical protein